MTERRFRLPDPHRVQQGVESSLVGSGSSRPYANRQVKDPTRFVEGNLACPAAETPGLLRASRERYVLWPCWCPWQRTPSIRPESLSDERKHAVPGSLLRDAGEARTNVSWRAVESKVRHCEPVDRLGRVRKGLCRRMPSRRVGERDAAVGEDVQRAASSARRPAKQQHHQNKPCDPHSHNPHTTEEQSQVHSPGPVFRSDP